MSERKYSVSEIGELRRACEDIWLWGSCSQAQRCGMMSRPHYANEKAVGVEELARTYMLAGVTAADLYESEKK